MVEIYFQCSFKLHKNKKLFLSLKENNVTCPLHNRDLHYVQVNYCFIFNINSLDSQEKLMFPQSDKVLTS